MYKHRLNQATKLVKQTVCFIYEKLKTVARGLNLVLRVAQSNHEGEIIDLLHRSRKWADGVVINPGAYTHYSYAIRDAIAAIQKPTVEVHLSDIRKREPFRRKSVIAPVCLKQVSGLGWKSYVQGLQILQRNSMAQ